MSDDLVKRPRDKVEASRIYDDDEELLDETANRIENLNYQIRIIQGAAAYAHKSYEQHLAVYRQKLDEKPPVWHDDIQSLQERDAIMTDRIEKLEVALRWIVEQERQTAHPTVCVIVKTARKALEGEDD